MFATKQLTEQIDLAETALPANLLADSTEHGYKRNTKQEQQVTQSLEEMYREFAGFLRTLSGCESEIAETAERLTERLHWSNTCSDHSTPPRSTDQTIELFKEMQHLVRGASVSQVGILTEAVESGIKKSTAIGTYNQLSRRLHSTEREDAVGNLCMAVWYSNQSVSEVMSDYQTLEELIDHPWAAGALIFESNVHGRANRTT